MEDEDNSELETISMTIIANSGAAHSMAYEALALAKANDFAGAKSKLKEADAQMNIAHKAHTRLLQMDAQGLICKVTSLSAHAQDHIMTGMVVLEMAAELIELYERKQDKPCKEEK